MSKENEKFDHAQVAELEHEPEIAYSPDYASEKTIREALEYADYAADMGYDEETANELRQMGGLSSYGASDLEQKLNDDSPAKAMLAEGYHSVLIENEEGVKMPDYPMVQAAVNDIAQAVGNIDHVDNDTRAAAHARYAEALTRREVSALEHLLENWSSTGGNAEEISSLTHTYERVTADHQENLNLLLNEIATTHEITNQMEAYSGETHESAANHQKETALTNLLGEMQHQWYSFSTSMMDYINKTSGQELPTAFRQELSNINYDLNKIIPEDVAAAYAIEDAGLMNAVDYLRYNAYHELGSAILDKRISTEDALDIAIKVDDIPKAMAYAQYGGDTTDLKGVEDPEPTYAKYYDEIKIEARQMLQEAVDTGNVREISEAIQIIQDTSVQTRLKAYNEMQPTR